MDRTWAILTAAPHRVLFLPGALQGVLAMGYWLAILLSGQGALPALPLNAVPAFAAHVWLMLYGIFPFFVFGFLFTAVPNWLEAPQPTRAGYLRVALPMALGAFLFYPGLYLPALTALALGLHLLGWTMALIVLWHLLRRRSPTPSTPAPIAVKEPAVMRTIQTVPAQTIDRRHARAALLACGLGALGEAAWLYGLLSDAPMAWRLAESLGVWGFLAPLFLAVCHRMIPWFTSRVVRGYTLIRPPAVLWGMVIACLAHATLETADLMAWLWLTDAPLALLTLWLAMRWYDKGIHRVRLLAMLHIAFPWAGIAFTLYTVDSLASLLDAGWGLGHAPLHALGIGFFASTLLAMASRVSLGHSGRQLEADGLTWALFWSIQLTALVRLLPELMPMLDHPRWMTLAAFGWLAAFAAWAWRYAPFYWQARVDGKAG